MPNFQKRGRVHPATSLTILLSASLIAVSLALNPAIARQFSREQPFVFSQSLPIAAGTSIPIEYDQAKKILLTKEETYTMSLTVTDSIKNTQGEVIIPNGSQIIGEIKPTSQGSQFFSQKIILKAEKPQTEPIDAVSAVLTRLEKIIKGVNPDQIIKGAVLGQSAAAVLAAFTEDKPLDRRLLMDGGLEVLAGWLLRGESVELLSIDPQKDLNLTLRSDFIRKE